MHRNKFGQEYDALPGGGIEIGESAEAAVYREIYEETMVQFTDPKLVFIEHAGDMYGDQFIFLCKYKSGEPQLHPDAIEVKINKLGKNLYKPAWLPLTDLPTSPFVSESLKQHILAALSEGWPTIAVEITTK